MPGEGGVNSILAVDQPCLCLCFGFSQMTMILPFLLMILHFSQIFLTDGFTFIGDYHAFLALLGVVYLDLQVMRPFPRSYTETSTVT